MDDMLIQNVGNKSLNRDSVYAEIANAPNSCSPQFVDCKELGTARKRVRRRERPVSKRPRKFEDMKPFSQVTKESNKMFFLNNEEGPLFQELCQHGIAGMSSIAAISSERCKEPSVEFEKDPENRKKLYAQYVQRLEDLLHEFSMRVGLQATVVVYEPSEVNTTNAMKIIGTSPIKEYVSKYAHHIQKNTHRKLKQMQKRVASRCDITFKPVSNILPPVQIHGIPTSVEDLTQAQLRSFLRMLLCEAEGRKTPQWHNPSMVPDWWPRCVPWQNIKTDQRTLESKRLRCWSDCLRHAIYKCYLYKQQTHLLPDFELEAYKQVYEQWELDPLPKPDIPLHQKSNEGLTEPKLQVHRRVSEVSSFQCVVQSVKVGEEQKTGAESEPSEAQATLLLATYPREFIETSSDEDFVEDPENDLLYLGIRALSSNMPLDFDSWLVSDQDILPKNLPASTDEDSLYLEEALFANDFAFSYSDPDSLLPSRVT